MYLANSAEVAGGQHRDAAIHMLAHGGHPASEPDASSGRRPSSRAVWGFVAANGTGWTGCRMAVEAMAGDRRCVVWFLSEHRLEVGEQMCNAEGLCRRMGLKMIASPALRTGDGATCTSAGTAICVRSYVGANAWSEWPRWSAWAARTAPPCQQISEAYIRSRISVAVVNGLVGDGFLAVAIYLQDGAQLGGKNQTLLRLLAGVLNGCGRRWVCAGDWNISPELLAESGFINLVQGRIVAAGVPTCASGAGSELDFFLVSKSLAGESTEAEVCYEVGTAPHWPV